MGTTSPVAPHPGTSLSPRSRAGPSRRSLHERTPSRPHRHRRPAGILRWSAGDPVPASRRLPAQYHPGDRRSRRGRDPDRRDPAHHGDEAPVFNPTQPGFQLHPEITARRTDAWKSSVKRFGSIYADTDIASWLREHNVDTVTVVGYMTNNCVIASAVEGEGLEFTTEVLSDATGAIHLANEAGSVDAK